MTAPECMSFATILGKIDRVITTSHCMLLTRFSVMHLITITTGGINARETSCIIHHFVARFLKTNCLLKAMRLCR